MAYSISVLSEDYPVPTSNIKRYHAVLVCLPQQGTMIYDQIFEDNIISYHQRETKVPDDIDNPVPIRVTDGTRGYDILDDLACPELSTLCNIMLAEISDLIDDVIGKPLDEIAHVFIVDEHGTIAIIYEEAKNGTD